MMFSGKKKKKQKKTKNINVSSAELDQRAVQQVNSVQYISKNILINENNFLSVNLSFLLFSLPPPHSPIPHSFFCSKIVAFYISLSVISIKKLLMFHQVVLHWLRGDSTKCDSLIIYRKTFRGTYCEKGRTESNIRIRPHITRSL